MSWNEGSRLERKEGLKNEASGRVHLLPYWSSEQALDHKLKNRAVLLRVSQVSGSLIVGCHYSWVRGAGGAMTFSPWCLQVVESNGPEQWLLGASATSSLSAQPWQRHLRKVPTTPTTGSVSPSPRGWPTKLFLTSGALHLLFWFEGLTLTQTKSILASSLPLGGS